MAFKKAGKTIIDTTSNSNVFVGDYAGSSISYGNFNTMVGSRAGGTNLTNGGTSRQVSIGYKAGGYGNGVAVGYLSKSAIDGTSVGYKSTGFGFNSIAIGYRCKVHNGGIGVGNNRTTNICIWT